MNKRIKELADASNAWYPLGYPSGEGGDEEWHNMVIFQKENLEKFVQSIIQDCTQICKDVQLEYQECRLNAVDPSQKILYATGESACKIIQTKFETHFSVGESSFNK